VDVVSKDESPGTINSSITPKKYPKQGLTTPYIKPKIDINRHGIRRETSLMPKPPKKFGRKKI